MPCESHDNESDFLNGIAHVTAVMEELDTMCVFVVGDINSDISEVLQGPELHPLK